MSSVEEQINDKAAYIAAAAGAVMIAIEATRKRKRKFWVNPTKYRRDNFLQTPSSLDKEIFSFENGLRMNRELFNELLSFVEDALTRQDTLMRKAIPVLERMIVTIKYLSSGDTYTALERQTNLSKSAICKIVQEACYLFQERLAGEFMPFPCSPEDWVAISQRFSRWSFPYCIGALAGRHTSLRTSRIDVPKRKHRGVDMLQILALVDADYKFILADIFRFNREREDDIRHSELMKTIEQSKDSFPSDDLSLQGRSMPYMFVADETFAMDEYVLTPYAEDQILTEAQREYNRRLLQAQDVANTAIAVLTERFRILYNDQCLNAYTIEYVFKAAVILHNYMVSRSKEYLDEMIRRTDLVKPKMLARSTAFSDDIEAAELNRQKFVELFLNVG